MTSASAQLQVIVEEFEGLQEIDPHSNLFGQKVVNGSGEAASRPDKLPA
jgi:hypothetical protein